MDDELLGMKNLGRTSVQWLHAAGIHTIADLRRLGAIQAYRAVQVRGFRASKALLYSLEGALSDRPWAELPQAHKDSMDTELKNASSGLIRERHIP
ncbi:MULTISPECIES: TfoX/Sxy family protein [Pseudomonas]|nr:competence protein TfoX [Pseudomonas sp. NZIPFR-PS5]